MSARRALYWAEAGDRRTPSNLDQSAMVSVHPAARKVAPPNPKSPPAASSKWILNGWKDLLLFVGPPILIAPLVLWLQANLMRSSIELLAILVGGFGALGHHLPGMIRAYGDPDLFARFKVRFIVAPLFLLAICIPLSQNSLSGMLLILLVWGYWHGLMQVYGFLRIYDAKVGSVAPITAWLDWLMCLAWFGAGMVFSNERLAHFLDTWYSGGGPLLPANLVSVVRTATAILTALITFAFCVNYFWQSMWGRRPNPNKLLMLGSAVVFWWFAMVYIQNALLGIAIFEIFHDVQYLAIVWIYNQRRVEKATTMGIAMRYLFRRSTLTMLLYVAVVFAYGFISIVANAVPDEGVRRTLIGLIWASTILHFYYDGFIWKVRETSTRDTLGLAGQGAVAAAKPVVRTELIHGLKWAPFVAFLTWMSVTELQHSSPPGPGMTHRAWPDDVHISWTENIVELVPDNLVSQARLAAMLDNAGRTDEAKQRLKQVLDQHPTFSEGHVLLGKIHQRLGEFDRAIASFQSALANPMPDSDRAEAYFHLGEMYHHQRDAVHAQESFEQVLKILPGFQPAVDAIRTVQMSAVNP